MALIAPSKISPKGDYLYVECFTTTGNQARTINQPIIWNKSCSLLETIPFAYGIDNRYFDGSHVHIKEISLKYFKNVKSNFDNGSRESLTTYQGSMFDVAVEQVTLKVNLGNDDPESDDISYGISLGLPWSDFETILPNLWKGCVDEWDRQLKEDYQAIQLNLMDQLKDKGLALMDSVKSVELKIVGQDDGPIDIAAYSYPEDQLIGRRGPLTGSALDAKKVSLIRKGIAVPINDNPDKPRPFGFDPGSA
jgi:hypothetical protein